MISRKNLQTKQYGFTLLELILYIALAGVVLFALLDVFGAIERSKVKQHILSEVEFQGQNISEIITQSLRNAQAITSPSSGATGTSLSLTTFTASTSPTTFSVTAGTLLMQEGLNSAVALTSSSVTVSNFSVQNLSRTGTHGTAKVSFTLNSSVATSSVNFSSSKTFYTSGTLRGTYP